MVSPISARTRSLSASGKDGHASAPNTPDSRVMTRYGHPSRSPSTTVSGIATRSLSTKLRERASFRGELAAKKWREDLQDEFFVERNDEVGAGGENVRRRACKAVAAGDIERDRQPLRRIGAPDAESLIVCECRQRCGHGEPIDMHSVALSVISERSEAIHASARGQMNCFASLAMTGVDTTDPDWPARTGAAGGCRARRRRRGLPARAACR